MMQYAYEKKVSPLLSITEFRKKIGINLYSSNVTHLRQKEMGAWMKAEWKLMPCILCTHQTQIMAGGPMQEWAQALARVNDRKGRPARTVLIIRCCLPSPVCLPRKALRLLVCICNDKLHLTVITQPCSPRNSKCCIFKSGPSNTISF